MLNFVSEPMEHGVETRSVLGMYRRGTGELGVWFVDNGCWMRKVLGSTVPVIPCLVLQNKREEFCNLSSPSVLWQLRVIGTSLFTIAVN